VDRLEAQKMALRKMAEWDLIEEGWTFCWLSRRATTTCGRCDYAIRAIRLNPRHVEANNPAEVLDTILHEIAHALAGPGKKHGPVWRKFAVMVGAKPMAKAGSEVVSVPQQPPLWMATCADCGTVIRRRRVSARVREGRALVHKGCKTGLRWRKIIRWEAACPDCGRTIKRARLTRDDKVHCRSTLVWTELAAGV